MTHLYTGSMSQNGQVTLPKPIREMLHLEKNGVVGFKVKGGKAEIVAVRIEESKNPYTKEEWKKIERLANQKGRRFYSAKEAIKHIESL